MEDNVPIPEYRNIQHHSLVDGVFACGKALQLFQFRAFQLSHKAHSADIYTKDGDTGAGGCLGHMQNRAVTTEADDQIRIMQFPVKAGKLQVFRKIIGSVHLKGQTKPYFDPSLCQNLRCPANRRKVLIPIGIGRHDYFFHRNHPFNVSWAS